MTPQKKGEKAQGPEEGTFSVANLWPLFYVVDFVTTFLPNRSYQGFPVISLNHTLLE
jgi:hypothetical protein